MTQYVDSYVKMMLKKHPQGEEFKIIEALIESNKKTNVVTDMHPIARFLFSQSTSSSFIGGISSPADIKQSEENIKTI